MKKNKKRNVSRRKHPSCGLCGSKTNLTKTECCGQWICDDADQYVPFSYAKNSCYRNHDHYTLCAHHYREGHCGNWKDCEQCKADFADELEMYVYFGTNEYNFEKLPNPPQFEPTYCSQCGKQIHLGTDGYSVLKDQYTCDACSEPLPEALTSKMRLNAPSFLDDLLNLYDDDLDDDWLEGRPERLGPDCLEEIPPSLAGRFEDIHDMIEAFCEAYDAVELSFICLDMLVSLCVQFPDKFRRSQPKSWAAGIVHAIGMVNFLSDPATKPYIESSEIYSWFKVAESTMQSKSRSLRDWFRICQMDPMWSLPELLLENPLMWTMPIDGDFVDLRQAPETVQQRAVQEGLIPITPNDFRKQIEENRKAIAKSKNKPAPLQLPTTDRETPNIKFADHLPAEPPDETLPLFDEPDSD